MHWISKPNRDHLKDGKERVITRFLLIPKTIEGITRWLEFAKIHQRYELVCVDADFVPMFEYRWNSIAWADGNGIKITIQKLENRLAEMKRRGKK
jgi:hypothetical protein